MIDALTRNVMVRGRRTSIRLEAAFWSTLDEILERERINLNGLVHRIDAAHRGRSNLSAAVRVFIYSYIFAQAHQQAPPLPPVQLPRALN
ncbi:ribbon-helix-helix domain-containing protein [Inquilinus limosus]|uniref:Ribbon-helix-helix domain-containing protein n=1 Tax=Inquilinus limosus TaxID=171674 RepID=A0A211ZTE2_9PROT|nr:ribbon-helix-helix domain-containing protein [Inquilinus limosus]OWJ68562.1 hypothetical protein BWR60_03895 [Inquilinus limosus]